MAIAKLNRLLSRRKLSSKNRCDSFEERTEKRGWWSFRGKTSRTCVGILAGLMGGCGTVLYCLVESVEAMDQDISLPSYPWVFARPFKSFDHSALRRGWTVYQRVCSTCHSLKYMRFMYLVDVTHTREEVKVIAAEYEVTDGPDETGKYFVRPAKLTDFIPPPFPNEQAARAANMGAYPVDLTFAIPSRRNGANYIFSLLTGFMDPPAGVRPDEGQYFNVYFPGGYTTMPQQLYTGMVEYDDGTPATESQMAKDIVEFLSWTAMQDLDDWKLKSIKVVGLSIILSPVFLHLYRRYWSPIRSRHIFYVPSTKFTDPPSCSSSMFYNERAKRQKG